MRPGVLTRAAVRSPDRAGRRAARHPHADLLRALRRGTGGHAVEADGRQDQRDPRESGQERTDKAWQKHRVSEHGGEVLVERGDAPPQSRVRVGIRLGQAGRDRVEIRLGPGDAHPVRQAAEDTEDVPVARVLREAGGERQPTTGATIDPERRALGEVEMLGGGASSGGGGDIDPSDCSRAGS